MKKTTLFTRLLSLFDTLGCWILAFIAALLNISLAFDNVVWGDEAYSQMAIINTDFHGVFERVYYWDSHPPLYYYYLKIFADIFGYKTSVYHIASLLPFIIGLVIACTIIKKHFGTLPSIFFIIISSFSESCVEYNLEIRMYSLVFLFVFLSICFSALIIKESGKTLFYVLMTLFGVLAAYTHYYGLAFCGLIVFFTGLFDFIISKKNEHGKCALISWITSTLAYIIAYIPWLFVLYKQTQTELNDSWMTEPAPFNDVLTFISGGDRLKPIIVPFIIVMTLVIIIVETKVFSIKATNTKGEYTLQFRKPVLNGFSDDFKILLLMYCCIIALLLFGYIVSYAFHPILAFRYTYVLIPALLIILLICIKKLYIYIYPNTSGALLSKEKELPKSKSSKAFTIVFSSVLGIITLLVLLFGLLDFKYFRSVTKTQDVETKKVLDIVGTPNDDAILVSNGVKHLAWSVLPYYYSNTVTMTNPDLLPDEPSEFWAFIGYEYDSEVIDAMSEKGYQTEYYPNMWLGKYEIYLYHFYK